METQLENIRREYTKGKLSKNDLPYNPFELFEAWLQDAFQAQEEEPTAMLIATVSAEGKPSTRTVLLKGVENERFIFYTNYNSRKGKQLALNPYISLSFVWHKLERQIHVEGKARKVAAAISDAYFKSRPYKSKIGARISPQSSPIPNRLIIMAKFALEALFYSGQQIERPSYWGGFAVTPIRFEFWQGRESRLHDRILYTLQRNNTWKKERLAP